MDAKALSESLTPTATARFEGENFQRNVAASFGSSPRSTSGP